MPLYNLKRLTPDTFMIAKFDDDFAVESTYTLTASRNGHHDCDCPAGSRSVVTKPCRHRLMLPALLPAVDTDRFYNYDTGKFCEPLGDLADLRSEVDQSPVVGEALRNDPNENHTMIYGTDEPPIVFDTHRVVEALPSPVLPSASQAPTIRRR